MLAFESLTPEALLKEIAEYVRQQAARAQTEADRTSNVNKRNLDSGRANALNLIAADLEGATIVPANSILRKTVTILTEAQQDVLAQLRKADCNFLAAATEDHWKRGEAYYIDDRVTLPRGLRAAFNKANPNPDGEADTYELVKRKTTLRKAEVIALGENIYYEGRHYILRGVTSTKAILEPEVGNDRSEVEPDYLDCIIRKLKHREARP